MKVNYGYVDKIREMREKGISYCKIADELGIAKTTVRKWETKYIKNGNKIEKRVSPFIEYNDKRRKEIEERIQKERQNIVVNDTPVKCTAKLAKTCIYGREDASPNADKCNFIGCTLCSRLSFAKEPPHVPTELENYTECWVYQHRTRENPKRRIKFGEIV